MILTIKLVMLGLIKHDSYCLLIGTEKDLYIPFANLHDGNTSLNIAKSLFAKETCSQGDWITPRQFPLLETPGRIVIPYGCMIPECVKFKDDTHWLPLLSIIDNKHPLNKEDIEAIIHVANHI